MTKIRRMWRRSGRHWSDWVGFVTFLAFAISMVVRAGGLTLMLAPTLLHELLVAFAFLMRRPAKAHLTGWQPRAASYCGSFVVLAFVQTAYIFHPEWLAPTPVKGLRIAATVIWAIGSVAGLWTLWSLRHSFSVEPQARCLVTNGPYRFARHPIYSSYVLQYFGIWLGRPTLPLAAAMITWFVFTVVRMHYEEIVLAATFPEYAGYRAHVGALAPHARGTVREKTPLRTAA